jgi:predicted metal-dependent phosphoesterase TrpH
MKYDLHIHTIYGTHGAFKFDSVIKPKDAVRMAIQKGLDGIAITDHDTMKAVKECRSYANNKLEIISGCEIASMQGHILAYGIDEWKEEKKDAFEVIEKIHELGGIAVAPHPFKTGVLKKGLQDFAGSSGSSTARTLRASQLRKTP